MRCDEARQLFNTHLDGELASTLAAELHAHRLQCPDCRRELAILEVTGHLIGTHDEPVALQHDFTDRLLACVETPAQRWIARMRRLSYVAVPLAAAAVIALAFLGVFDRGRESVVAGVKIEPIVHNALPTSSDAQAADRAINEWVANLRANVQLKKESGQSLQKALDLTILQVLDILEEASDGSANPAPLPGANDQDPFPADAAQDDADSENVEDL